MRKALTTTRTARASKPGERATPTRTARATKPGKRATLTPAQKAAATKRRNGLDLSAIARKALATPTIPEQIADCVGARLIWRSLQPSKVRIVG